MGKRNGDRGGGGGGEGEEIKRKKDRKEIIFLAPLYSHPP